MTGTLPSQAVSASYVQLLTALTAKVVVGVLRSERAEDELAVAAGSGALDCDVVIVEQRGDLSRAIMERSWSTEDMAGALRPRGFSHYALIVHRGARTILQWDEGEVPSGSVGNLIFLHDRVLAEVLPDVLACASSLAQFVVDSAETEQLNADPETAT
jgi:hypothetical protein